MSRYRYLIERAEGGSDVYCSLVDDTDAAHSVGAVGMFDNAADAKLAAEADARGTGNELCWKKPPKAWEPDALCISQFLDDGVSENRDV